MAYEDVSGCVTRGICFEEREDGSKKGRMGARKEGRKTMKLSNKSFKRLLLNRVRIVESILSSSSLNSHRPECPPASSRPTPGSPLCCVQSRSPPKFKTFSDLLILIMAVVRKSF